jgi:hypothetical protein
VLAPMSPSSLLRDDFYRKDDAQDRDVRITSFGLLLCASAVLAQEPLAPIRGSGQTVTPVFEGWYRNPDGTFSLSFGYFNRNGAEVVDVPIGPNNNISPGDANQGQPTHFHPRRHWGVFAVRVPADFGDKKVVWTLNFRGESYAIPGALRKEWEIDALAGEAGSGNTPPEVKLAPAGPVARGPAGATLGPVAVKVGVPLALSVWATDDGKAERGIASEGRANVPVSLTWFVHQGPSEVEFSPGAMRAGNEGLASTSARFAVPGDYVLRVRANDASGVDNAGHAQCCWTNAFVRVSVSK